MIMVTAAHLVAVQGKSLHAAICLGTAQVLIESFHTHLWPIDRQIYESYHNLLKDKLGEDTFSSAVDEGRKRGADLEQSLAFVLENLGSEQAARRPRKTSKPASGILTSREKEIVALISQGMNNSEIAQALYLGVRTVEAHITHIFNKLNFSSRTQVALWAVNKEMQDPAIESANR